MSGSCVCSAGDAVANSTLLDVVRLLDTYGTCRQGSCVEFDFDCDGNVNSSDIGLLFRSWVK